MNTTTLKGVFPEPKPVPRRNFMRENIKQLKQMQGLTDKELSVSQSQVSTKINPKYRHVPSRVFSNLNNHPRGFNFETRKPFGLNLRGSAPERSREKKIVHRGVQTERSEDASKLVEGPNLSPKVLKKSSLSSSPTRRDQGDSLAKSLQKLAIDEKHDYVKANIKNIKQKLKEDSPDPTLPPKEYHKGGVPKYLSKHTGKNTGDAEDKSNLALLPDEERKEYLRVARENYAGLIKELNTMPIRNDTLKKRNRKIQIEEELKRLDEVIRIFQKPKVFVKADA